MSISLAAIAGMAKPVLAVLTAGITVPVWLIVGGGLWLHYDKNSAVRQAVDRATTQLVAGAELAAKDQKIHSLEKIAAAREARASALETANRNLQASLELADTAYQESLNDLEELAATPPPDDCRVDADLLERLRNR